MIFPTLLNAQALDGKKEALEQPSQSRDGKNQESHAPSSSGLSRKIAVLQLINQAEINEEEMIYLTSQIQEQAHLRVMNHYQILTQENIFTQLPPNKALEDCLKGECEAEIGKQLGASLILTGQILKFGTKQELRCVIKLHETQTGILLGSQTIRAKTINDIENELSGAIDDLFKKVPLTPKPIVTQKDLKSLTTPVPLVLILIKGGLFLLGSQTGEADPKLSKWLKIKDFYMSKSEVTVKQYQDCIDAQVCTLPHWDDGTCLIFEGHQLKLGIAGENLRGPNQPVVCVDWEQARAFAKWVGGDLPSEAQWEYAMKSKGSIYRYPWGLQEASCELAIMYDSERGCGKARAWDVCSREQGNTKQNLCDMAGNVWEWIRDEWHPSYENYPVNEEAWCRDQYCANPPVVKRVFRGGSWGSTATALQNTSRSFLPNRYRAVDVGFRIVKASP